LRACREGSPESGCWQCSGTPVALLLSRRWDLARSRPSYSTLSSRLPAIQVYRFNNIGPHFARRGNRGRPGAAFFSLTPGRNSVILNSLRGVAPGVCVYSPGPGWSMPWRDRLEQATGGWMRGFFASSAEPEPFEGQPRCSHPNRFVWTWVEEARAFLAWASTVFAREFWPGQAGFSKEQE